MFIEGDFGFQRLSRSFHLLGTDFHSRQLLALVEAHQRGRARRQAQKRPALAKTIPTPEPGRARPESALALPTVPVGALQVHGPQDSFEGLLVTAMIRGGAAAGPG